MQRRSQATSGHYGKRQGYDEEDQRENRSARLAS